MTNQRTLSNKVSCSGIGLHSGSQVNMVINPAPANTGIMFKRMDVPAEKSLVPALYNAVSDTRLGTTIVNNQGVGVSTIEHLMAALWGIGVDNALIELDGPEVPIMDGSSEPFVFMLECAGTVALDAPRRVIRILKPVEVRDGQSVARVSPSTEGEEGISISIEIEYNNGVVGHQASHYDFRDVSFKQSLSRARTFGFEQEINALRQMGLALGGSLDNAIVVGKDKILNKEGLRFNDEFVRHKALDCVGDLFLAGLRIDGHFNFVRPGHGINNKLLRALLADDSAWDLVEHTDAPAALFSSAPQPVNVAAYA